MKNLNTKRNAWENTMAQIILSQLSEKQKDIEPYIAQWKTGSKYGPLLRGFYRRHLRKKYKHLLPKEYQ